MKWFSVNKYRPVHTGDQVIFLLKGGYIHAGVYDYQKDNGYFFESHEGGQFMMNEITHFCIPDPIEIE